MVFDPERWAAIVERDLLYGPGLSSWMGGPWTVEDVDAYEREIGFVLPAGYRWLLENYPELPLEARAIWRRNRVEQISPKGLVFPRVVEPATLGRDERGWLRVHELVPGLSPWERQLLSCLVCVGCDANGSMMAFDFTFDPVDPPIVEIFLSEETWYESITRAESAAKKVGPQNEGVVRFVVDRFDMLFEAPAYDEELDVAEFEPPKPTREQEWLAWRDQRYLELGADWLEEQARLRAEGPTREQLEQRVAEARSRVDEDNSHWAQYTHVGVALTDLGDPDSLAEAVTWYERAIEAGDTVAAPVNLAKLRERLANPNKQ